MLGPVDLDDWLDEDELSAILSDRREIQTLRADAAIFSLRGWSAGDFALARRFANGETLRSDEMRRLAQCMGG
jgi:ornithine cyclodeaminase/alanine dehydrogenase-like protein (mu-crystallin family)